MKRIKNQKGLKGVEGLTLAIIAQSVNDAIDARDRDTMLDAWAYFGGDWYRLHADSLGMAPDTWPAALIRMDVDEYMRITDRILGR